MFRDELNMGFPFGAWVLKKQSVFHNFGHILYHVG